MTCFSDRRRTRCALPLLGSSSSPHNSTNSFWEHSCFSSTTLELTNRSESEYNFSLPGNTCGRSREGQRRDPSHGLHVKPNQIAIPFHKDSQLVVGWILPRPRFRLDSSITCRSDGYSPRTLPCLLLGQIHTLSTGNVAMCEREERTGASPRQATTQRRPVPPTSTSNGRGITHPPVLLISHGGRKWWQQRGDRRLAVRPEWLVNPHHVESDNFHRRSLLPRSRRALLQTGITALFPIDRRGATSPRRQSAAVSESGRTCHPVRNALHQVRRWHKYPLMAAAASAFQREEAADDCFLPWQCGEHRIETAQRDTNVQLFAG